MRRAIAWPRLGAGSDVFSGLDEPAAGVGPHDHQPACASRPEGCEPVALGADVREQEDRSCHAGHLQCVKKGAVNRTPRALCRHLNVRSVLVLDDEKLLRKGVLDVRVMRDD